MRCHRSLLCIAAAVLGTAIGCHRANQSKPLIAIIVPSEDNPFFKAEADAAASRAIALGYRVRVDSHNDDAYRQDNLVDAAIASNAAVLILDNAGSDASVSAVRRATRAGIACFLIDREIAATGYAKAQIIADNEQGSRLVAAEFARSLGDGKDYAELLGRESDTNAQIRTNGFHYVLDKIPGLRLVWPSQLTGPSRRPFKKPKRCFRLTETSPGSSQETTPWRSERQLPSKVPASGVFSSLALTVVRMFWLPSAEGRFKRLHCNPQSSSPRWQSTRRTDFSRRATLAGRSYR